jgi:predicted  nucleic acid-binding Zn-ribbon protein
MTSSSAKYEIFRRHNATCPTRESPRTLDNVFRKRTMQQRRLWRRPGSRIESCEGDFLQENNFELRKEAGQAKDLKHNLAQANDKIARLRLKLGQENMKANKLGQVRDRADEIKTQDSQPRHGLHNLKQRTKRSSGQISEFSASEAYALQAAAERALHESEEKCQSLEKSEGRLREKNAELLRQSEEKVKRFQGLSSRLAKAQGEATRAQEKAKQQTQELSKLNITKHRLEKEIENFRKTATENRIPGLMLDENVLKAAQNEVQELREKRTDLLNKLQGASSTNEALRHTNEALIKRIAELDDTISKLRRQDTGHRARVDKKAADNAVKSAKAKTDAMFAHYDIVQNKNTVLIGKLTMMAQAGGFGNPGSNYRKELDALKVPSLEELDECKNSD